MHSEKQLIEASGAEKLIQNDVTVQIGARKIIRSTIQDGDAREI